MKDPKTIDPVHAAGGCYCKECEKSTVFLDGYICEEYGGHWTRDGFCSNGLRGRTLMTESNPCRMCDNARVNDELTDSCDLSYISIGDCEKGFRFMLASGDGKPVRIEFEHLYSDGLWHLVGIYHPSFCPNCGRKLSEYGADAWNRKESKE